MSSRLLTAAIAALTLVGAAAVVMMLGEGVDRRRDGAALGSYGGRPYYCRHHHHWRWSHRLGRYVYDYRNYC